MKVYVSELPNGCHNCCFECDCFCCINGNYVIDNYFKDTKHKDCPLQPLTDHTKQVRKEVVEEIKEKLKENELLYTWKGEPKYKTMEEILDQIQGNCDE